MSPQYSCYDSQLAVASQMYAARLGAACEPRESTPSTTSKREDVSSCSPQFRHELTLASWKDMRIRSAPSTLEARVRTRASEVTNPWSRFVRRWWRVAVACKHRQLRAGSSGTSCTHLASLLDLPDLPHLHNTRPCRYEVGDHRPAGRVVQAREPDAERVGRPRRCECLAVVGLHENARCRCRDQKVYERERQSLPSSPSPTSSAPLHLFSTRL
jgi:hypothetical protein